MQRSTNRPGETDEMFPMPGNPTLPARAGPEFVSDTGHLRTLPNEIFPPLPVGVGTCIDVQRRGHSFVDELLPDERNTLHTVQIIPPRLIGEQAIIRGCNEG